MIFVTVGGQLPFDRLVHTVDRWAMEQGHQDVFAQIGASENPPQHIRWQRFVSPSEFRVMARDADVIIAHAGMGSILTAIELEKPIIVMPRRAHLGEHRSDHQWATVKRLGDEVAIEVAEDEAVLLERLGRLEKLRRCEYRRTGEYQRLLDFLHGSIESSG